MENYELLSLENHLFFARIMKEHALFLEAGFPCKNADHVRKAERFKLGFEGILSQAAELGNGIVSGKILRSGELFTDYTLDAEEQTAFLTGIRINSRITRQERQMMSGCGRIPCGFSAQVERLNERALRLLDGLIGFKEEILREVTECHLYTANYPLLIGHIIREAKLYRCLLRKLQGYEVDVCCELQVYEKNGCCQLRAYERTDGCGEQIYERTDRCKAQSYENCERHSPDGCCGLPAVEIFWNQIMMEHALFIRGLLDPSEEELIVAADSFAKEYRALLAEAKRKDCMAAELTEKTIQETARYRDFKAAGTKGISECRIRSLILPLLADHVLREANHYLRLLEKNFI